MRIPILDDEFNKLIDQYGKQSGIYKYDLNGQEFYARDMSEFKKENNIISSFDEALTKEKAYNLLIDQKKYEHWKKTPTQGGWQSDVTFIPGSLEMFLDSQIKRL